jgi:thiol-disulfide isomerase/thioredoxin
LRGASGPPRHRNAWRAAVLGAIAATPLWAATDPGAIEPDSTFNLSAYKGQVVVLDFWASWCKPCRRSIPWLNQMRARYGERGLVVIGVNVDKDRAEAERFLREVPIEFDVIFDPEGTLAARYEVEGMPSTYVFSREGTLMARHLGFQNARRDEYEALISRLLQ